VKFKSSKNGLLIFVIMSYLSILLVISSVISIFQSKDKEFTRSEVVEYARRFLTDEDLRYKGKLLDCSGYAQLVYQHFNVELPHSSNMQFESLPKRRGDYQPGDLLFFSTLNRKIGHVGIFIGDNQFIHSPGKQKYVRIDSLNHEYWVNRLVGFRSVFEKDEGE
jgi:cell wall-associated NlpC family hydrolase